MHTYIRYINIILCYSVHVRMYVLIATLSFELNMLQVLKVFDDQCSHTWNCIACKYMAYSTVRGTPFGRTPSGTCESYRSFSQKWYVVSDEREVSMRHAYTWRYTV